MRPEVAVAAAAAEGLTLALGRTGYWGVTLRKGGIYMAQVKVRNAGREKTQFLGTFESAEEAALTIARAFPERTAALAAAQTQFRNSRHHPSQHRPTHSLEEVEQLALAEGLTLLRDASSTGFVGVYPKADSTRYAAKLKGSSGGVYVGTYETAHQAALAISRKLGPAESAAMAEAPPRNCAGWVVIDSHEVSDAEAKRLAAEEGLQLRRKRRGAASEPSDSTSSSASAYWGVQRAASVCLRWWAGFYDPSQRRPVYIGQFASAAGAALAIARRLRDDAPLAAALSARQAERKAGRQGGGKKRKSGAAQLDGAAEAEACVESVGEGEGEQVGDVVLEAYEIWSDDSECEGMFEVVACAAAPPGTWAALE